ncbi:hypothetical protein ASD70_15140 [Pseudomonas sp. Root569]|nr:hypothetical protein ASD70_15140 [Pseudomonas sp. Root569]
MLRCWLSQRETLMLKKLLAACAASLLLTGCVKPTPEQLENPDYGPYPFDYDRTIKAYMARTQPDPDSTKFQFLGDPIPMWNGIFGLRFGYGMCVIVNAKNIYGGYAGQELWFFMLRGDQVMETNSARVGGHPKAFARVKCEKVGFNLRG